MPRFPSREADVASLANRIISGLREHAEDFPNPPHAADQLQASADAFEESYDAAVVILTCAALVSVPSIAAQSLEERVAGLETQVAERADDFRPDPRLTYGRRAELADYDGSGYDRGLLAPAAVFKRSAEAMSQTCLLSNMTPQTPSLNRLIWHVLEEDLGHLSRFQRISGHQTRRVRQRHKKRPRLNQSRSCI